MEDDKGLDLRLGLPVGGSSSRPKDRNDSSTSDTANDDVDRTLKIVNDFKNFLNGGIPQQMPTNGFQRFDVLKPPGNFFGNFHHASVVGDASGGGVSGRKFWSPGTGIDTEAGEKGPNPVVGDKRKNSFEEIENNQKKQETETRTSELLEKTRASHVSLTTEDGSTADNEDGAESEAATSRSLSNLEDGSKQHVSGASNSSDVSKEMHGKVSAGSTHPPFSWQPESTMNVTRSITITESGQVVSGSGRGLSSYPLSSMVAASTANGDRPQGSNSVKMMNFSFSQGQLPSLDKDHLQGLIVTQEQPIHPPFASRGASASDGKQPVVGVEESSLPSRAEDASKPSSSALKTPAESEDPLEYPSIRPGLAAELKFGGSGSVPNLPWVSTTAPGPNGRTISGVTYKFSASQIKIVCACHGRHFSPEEFIQHASEKASSSPAPGGANSTNGVTVTSGAGLASATVSTTNTASSAAIKS